MIPAIVLPVADTNPKNDRLARALFDIGFRAAIVAVDAQNINPERHVWWPGFHPTQQWLQILTNVGFNPIAFKWTFAPAHATVEGKITYQSYTRGIGKWTLTKDNPNDRYPRATGPFVGPDFTLSWAKEPANIDPDWTTEFTYRSAIECAAFGVKYFIDWNEPGDGNYWPPVSTLNNYDLAYDRLRQQIIQPATKGRNLSMSDGKIAGHTTIGPEAAYDDDLRRLMDEPVYAINSFHCYDLSEKPSVDGALNVLAARRDILKQRADKTKTVWATEFGDGGAGWLPDYYKRIPEVYPDLGLFAVLPSETIFFANGSFEDDGITLKDNYILTDTGKAFKAYLRERQRVINR